MATHVRTLAHSLDRGRQIEQRIEHSLAAIHHVLRQRHDIGNGKDVAAGVMPETQPLRESSTTAHSSAQSRALAGEQVHLGIGLAVYDVLAAGHRLKLIKEADRLKVALGGNMARRRRKTT